MVHTRARNLKGILPFIWHSLSNGSQTARGTAGTPVCTQSILFFFLFFFYPLQSSIFSYLHYSWHLCPQTGVDDTRIPAGDRSWHALSSRAASSDWMIPLTIHRSWGTSCWLALAATRLTRPAPRITRNYFLCSTNCWRFPARRAIHHGSIQYFSTRITAS